MRESKSISPHADPADLLVAVDVGELTILLPGDALRDLEHVMDMRPGADFAPAIGSLRTNNDEWPVFALSRALKPAPAGASGAKICALVDTGQVRFGLMSVAVTMHPKRDLRLTPLPPPMAMPGSPVTSITLLDERIALVVDPVRLADALGVSSATSFRELQA